MGLLGPVCGVYPPKRQVDPRSDRFGRLWHAVPPMMLARPAHDQQTAVREHELQFLTGGRVLQHESPFGPQ